MTDIVVIRIILVAVLATAAATLHPFGLAAWAAGACGALAAGGIVVFEIRLRGASLKRLIGAAAGSILGILGAFLISLMIHRFGLESHTESFLVVLVLAVMSYVGLIVGADKGDLLNLAALGGLFGAERTRRNAKLLDTSAIIDGRIAHIAACGFLEGALLIPQFILRELQQVADSPDPQKRSRGRRGLDVLQRMQKLAGLEVRIVEEDVPHRREVDHKLIELARRLECKLVTNDGNLCKLAQLQQVQVLNVHELASSLKPVVLPGETMRVSVLKEGKEHGQGVAYLDDGTMVVVENGRSAIGHSVDIAVTSALQTTAGKMIFGRIEEAASLHA